MFLLCSTRWRSALAPLFARPPSPLTPRWRSRSAAPQRARPPGGSRRCVRRAPRRRENRPAPPGAEEQPGAFRIAPVGCPDQPLDVRAQAVDGGRPAGGLRVEPGRGADRLIPPDAPPPEVGGAERGEAEVAQDFETPVRPAAYHHRRAPRAGGDVVKDRLVDRRFHGGRGVERRDAASPRIPDRRTANSLPSRFQREAGSLLLRGPRPEAARIPAAVRRGVSRR